MDAAIGVVTGKSVENDIFDLHQVEMPLKEANERLFVMYAQPIQDELDRQCEVIKGHGGALPEGKYRIISYFRLFFLVEIVKCET